MLRIGFGKHEGVWFIRIDLWWAGFRFKKAKKNEIDEKDDPKYPWNWRKHA